MLQRRKALGGFLPSRRTDSTPLAQPADKTYDVVRKGSGKQEVATTMAVVRILKELLRDKEIGKRIVPIIPDEARTFGMDSWFPSLKIYNRNGQLYTSVDAELMLAYKESEIGQILHEGINEAGSTASFTAVGTSYATHGEPMIPVYIFYSMFGFQRTGDGLWAAADQMARGFVLGATAAAPRSPVRVCSTPMVTRCCWRRPTRPRCRTTRRSRTRSRTSSRTVCAACTAARRRRTERSSRASVERTSSTTSPSTTSRTSSPPSRRTSMSRACSRASTCSPAESSGVPEGRSAGSAPRAQILVSGVTMPDGLRAQQLLADEWGVAADVWSVTSWGELRRDGIECEREALRNPGVDAPEPYVTKALSQAQGPFVAASDWMRAVPDQIRQWVPGSYTTLGTDGFGFSDTRPAARRFFNVDAESITVAVLSALAKSGEIDRSKAAEAAARYRIDDVLAAPKQTSDPGVA